MFSNNTAPLIIKNNSTSKRKFYVKVMHRDLWNYATKALRRKRYHLNKRSVLTHLHTSPEPSQL